jgi:hypothetical protein
MSLERKIQITLIFVPILAFAYTCNRGKETYHEGVRVVTDMDTESSESDKKDVFSPSIMTASDVMAHLSIRQTADGFLYHEPATPLLMKNAATDYGVSLFDVLKSLPTSECGLRPLQYVGPSYYLPTDRESVRIFWNCDGSCESVVSEVTHSRAGDRLGRHISVTLPNQICSDTWSGKGLPLTNSDQKKRN